MTNFEKIIISLVGLLFIAVLAFGLILLSQQKAIRNLENGTIAGQAVPGSVSQNAKTAIKSPGLTSVIKQFSGEVTAVSGNELTVKAELTDFSKPKNLEKVKNVNRESGPLKADDFEILEKNITVKTGPTTVWGDNKSMLDVKVGSRVIIVAYGSPYESDTVMAEKISIVRAE